MSGLDLEALIKRALEQEIDLHFREVLRETQDGLQSIHYDHHAGRSLNSFWEGTFDWEERFDVDEYWTDAGLRCPEGKTGSSITSRRTFKYPHFTIHSILPAPDLELRYYPLSFFSGVPEIGTAIEFHSTRGTPWDVLAYGPLPTAGTHPEVRVNGLLPADYTTVKHTYTLKVNRFNVEFLIDAVLRAVLLFGCDTPRWQNTFPYALMGGMVYPMAELVPFISVGSHPTAPTLAERTMALSPKDISIFDGDPMPPRSYKLYEEETENLFTDTTIAAGSLTSHPVPVWGYPEKIVNLRASQQGTLSIENVTGRTGTWREYDTMGITQDKLKTYLIEGNVILVRAVYTPNTYPCTISEAEMLMI